MKAKYKYGKRGEIIVPDTEAAEGGVLAKFSIDYMKIESEGDDKAASSMVMVNHEDGGIFSYATLGKGIAGDKYWLPKRMAKDIDNCGTKDVKIQIKSDQELNSGCSRRNQGSSKRPNSVRKQPSG